MLTQINEAVETLTGRISLKPETGIVLGTGLGGLTKEIDITQTIPYEEIPGFPLSTVESHQGELVFGTVYGRNVVAMRGRFHYYEGYSMQQLTFPIRVMKKLGIEQLILSNASGGLNPAYEKGDLMVIEDHINLLPANPLTGKNIDELGPRFPDMSQPYERKMIDYVMEVAEKNNIRCHKGVYAVVSGPNLETPAEYKYLRIIGGDTVGMSTVPEVIVARHMGLPCFAISIITDLGIEGKIKEVDISEIIEVAGKAEPKMTLLIKQLIKGKFYK